ncbi:restriction endonuclease subunit S [Cellulosilyticum sp. WCF-2]|uniref:restriction endonuclease subunit S n=1 Tax=Cellulosilyticum sp. WCF-2 TaxID=2497860 RepID=UPI000F8E0C27|nr:restriction endonuclease subunit S [Cellulosilyticum sp. WCF-2]QEH69322.1 restriction endonuclease subunit S [Cellulosilyticum sp. WCF-2]
MKKYEEYIIEKRLWNTAFPAHWQIKPLYGIGKVKSICDCIDMPLLSVYLDIGVIPFSAKAEKRTNATSKDLSKYQRVDCGDLVLNNQQAWRGSVGVSNYEGIVSPAYIIVSLDNNLSMKYANYIFRSQTMVSQYVINSKGVGSIQRNIYWQGLKRTLVPIPPREEQDQIVHYLDWQVSKINRLIDSKKKAIRRITELKKTVVNEVVTRGLNSNVPMKFSGIDWLGDIPAHWKTIKLRQILHPFSEKNHPELPLLSVVREQGVIVRDVENKESNHNFIPDDLSGYKMVKKGQFVMNKMKAWQGSYGISDYTGIVSPAYFIFDVNFENLKYFHYAIRSKVYVNFFAQASDGIRVGQWDLSINKMKEIPFIVPPIEEQKMIVDYIPLACAKYDTAIVKLTEEIEVLHELRNKLISDVVTGQIDVRDIEVPEFEYVEEIEDLSENDEEVDDESVDGEV